MWLKGVKKIYALEPNKEAFEVLKKFIGHKQYLLFKYCYFK